MKKNDLRLAIIEAERFLERAKQVAWTGQVGYEHPMDSTISAAVKRSSMDLTRALARLRR